MKPHITLVNPAAPAGAVMHWPFALLGLGYLAAVLEKNNYQVDVIDCQVSQLTLEEYKKEIEKRKPDVVGVTSSTLTYKSGLKLIKAAREVQPNIITFAGGPHVTFWDDHALEECPELDIVVRREGEETLLTGTQNWKLAKLQRHFGALLSIRRENRQSKGPPLQKTWQPTISARHLWPMEKFSQYENVLYLAMTRGCVYWCGSAALSVHMAAPYEAPKRR